MRDAVAEFESVLKAIEDPKDREKVLNAFKLLRMECDIVPK